MKKFYFALFALLLFGLISFSEGKPCPERSRPHKTRCNAYYKCTVIDKKKHVWVPAVCEEGLIYEHSLGVCVLPGDDWECGQKSITSPHGKKTNRNNDADLYIIANAEEEDDEDNMISSKFDDGKVEIIIGTDLSNEHDDDENGSDELNEGLYDGSGNGAELVELDGFMQAATNRETEDGMTRKEDKNDETILVIPQMEKKEELQEVLHTIKTKAEIGQPSSNIDPTLTAHLQRLSQLVDGLKKTYQSKGEEKPQYDLKPDQLNAFLAHFNIKNKFNIPDANEKKHETNYSSNNYTMDIRKGASNNLNPETKVMLNNNLPKRYMNQQSTDGSQNSGGYSNSQIVINRPGGAVLFSLPPDHHFVEHSEYSADNSPKVSEETLKTVLELSKQMIASQNVPKIIPNPAYYGSPIMQPVFLTPHVDSPFSSNYYGDSMGSQSAFSSDFSTQSGKHKRPGKRPHQGKNPTTIIHNNVIPVHVSAAGSGDKDVVDSYGQSLSLYPPLNGQGERPETTTAYNGGAQLTYDSNKYHTSHTTKRPSPTDSPLYSNSPRPYDFQPTSETFHKYFTPTDHLNENNINQIFQTTDNFGSVPQPVKLRRPSSASSPSNYQQQSYNPNQGNQDNYGSIYSQMENNQIYGNQNSQSLYPNQLQQQSVSQYSDSNTDEFETISYVYNQKEPSQVQSNLQTQMQYSESPSQSVFSTNTNPYRPNSLPQFTSSSSSYSGSPSNNNKYSSVSSPISSATSSSSFAEGAQLVNVGGNFISFDVFRNTILPLVGGNSKASSALGNVEVITCAAGVRQPNTTDCTRYYVCSKKDGKVLSYSCPPYTAFNSESRICDARTYALCNPDTTMVPNYSVSENKRIQMETLKALQDAKRKQTVQQQQQQQIQAQQMANILQQYKPSSALSNSNSLISSPSATNSGEQNMLQSYMQQAAAMASMAQTTARPNINASSSSKKRKYYCKEGDKIADQTSINSYFVCFKNAQGQMKGHKMTCSKGLIFCPKSTMCTLPSKCS